MACRSKVLLAAAAVCAALFMQGCDIPAFVYGQCEAALEPTVGQASANGLQMVQSKCRSTFTSRNRQNMCISSGQTVLSLAKTRVLPVFAQQCAKFTVDSVCKEGSDCYKEEFKIGYAESAIAVIKYLQGNGHALALAMEKRLETDIGKVVTEKYDTEFANRAVPMVIKAQCENAIAQNVPVDVMNLPTEELQKQCSAGRREASWIAACQDDGMQKMFASKAGLLNSFIGVCAASSLSQACSKGSDCAIETGDANTETTELFANSYMFLHKLDFLANLKKQLMSDAEDAEARLLSKPRTSRLFGAFKLPTQHVKMGLLVWASTGALVAGVGLMAVAMAAVRILRKRSARSFDSLAEENEEELLVVA